MNHVCTMRKSLASFLTLTTRCSLHREYLELDPNSVSQFGLDTRTPLHLISSVNVSFHTSPEREIKYSAVMVWKCYYKICYPVKTAIVHTY